MLIPFAASLAAPLVEEAAWIGRLSRDLAQSAQGASLPAALAIFFVGGLLASLTPCVYPMIPIVVAYMGGAESSAAGREGIAVLTLTIDGASTTRNITRLRL